MSLVRRVVERRSASKKRCGWEARFPRFFKAEGIAN
jgi:hypothetical protein